MNRVGLYITLPTFRAAVTRVANRYRVTQNCTRSCQSKIGQTITMQQSASTASVLPYYVHTVTIRQESVRTKGRIIEFEIPVIDTHPGDNEKPTVVGVHGSPGSAMDFEPCIQKLLDKDIRFVGPTFPGCEGTEVESWKLDHLDYSSSGYASIVQQVVEKLRINKVSTVMCHSAGGWPGYALAVKSQRVKSLCLLNPGGAKPHRAMRPTFLIHFVAWLMRIQWLHFILMPLLKVAYHKIGFADIKEGNHLMVAQQVLTYQNFDATKDYATEIQKQRMPLMFAYSQNDKLIEGSVYEDMLFDCLRVPQSSVISVDSEKRQAPLCRESPGSEPDTEWFTRGLRFERGGHIVHKAYNPIIMQHLLQLLHHVENHGKTKL